MLIDTLNSALGRKIMASTDIAVITSAKEDEKIASVRNEYASTDMNSVFFNSPFYSFDKLRSLVNKAYLSTAQKAKDKRRYMLYRILFPGTLSIFPLEFLIIFPVSSFAGSVFLASGLSILLAGGVGSGIIGSKRYQKSEKRSILIIEEIKAKAKVWMSTKYQIEVDDSTLNDIAKAVIYNEEIHHFKDLKDNDYSFKKTEPGEEHDTRFHIEKGRALSDAAKLKALRIKEAESKAAVPSSSLMLEAAPNEDASKIVTKNKLKLPLDVEKLLEKLKVSLNKLDSAQLTTEQQHTIDRVKVDIEEALAVFYAMAAINKSSADSESLTQILSYLYQEVNSVEVEMLNKLSKSLQAKVRYVQSRAVDSSSRNDASTVLKS